MLEGRTAARNTAESEHVGRGLRVMGSARRRVWLQALARSGKIEGSVCYGRRRHPSTSMRCPDFWLVICHSRGRTRRNTDSGRNALPLAASSSASPMVLVNSRSTISRVLARACSTRNIAGGALLSRQFRSERNPSISPIYRFMTRAVLMPVLYRLVASEL